MELLLLLQSANASREASLEKPGITAAPTTSCAGGPFFRDATVANRIATREAEEKGESTQFESWSSKISEEPQARREEAHKGSSRVEVKKGEFAESPKRQRKLADKLKIAVNRKKAGRLQLSGSFVTEVSRDEPSDADGEENRSLPVPV